MRKRGRGKTRKPNVLLYCGIFTGLLEMTGVLFTGLAAEGKVYLARYENLWGLLGIGLVTAALTGGLLYMLWQKAGKWMQGRRVCGGLWGRPAFYWVVLLLGWLPCFLAYYPAIYSYDGEPQLIQYTQHAFNNHHPLAHTLILGFCYDIGQFFSHKLHIPLDGMAIYSVLQMFLLSGAFTCGFAFLIRRRASKGMLAGTLLWCVLFPVHPLMAVSTTKDTFFTAFFLLDFFLLLSILEEKDTKRKRWVYFCLANLGLMLFRKNGVYIQLGLFGICILITLACFVRRARDVSSGLWLRLSAVLLASLCLFFASDRLLVQVTGAQEGEAAEALSLPLQQVARIYKSNGDSLQKEDLDALTVYIPTKGLENYRPYISDGVKQYFNNTLFEEDPVGFFRIYMRLLRKYPGSAFTALIYQTMGDWFLTDVSHCLVYQDWWRDRIGYLITDATPVFAGNFVKKENLLPGVRNLYEGVATNCIHHRFLPSKLLFSPALYCLLTLFSGIAFLKNKRYRQLLAWAALMLYFLTVFAGPCVLVRYIYPFMAIAPFLAFEALKKSN